MAKIDSKGARDKLPFRREPHWQRLDKGLFVGYRTSQSGGVGFWRGRWRDEDGKQQFLSIEPGDIRPDPPGRDTAYTQASEIIRNWKADLTRGVVNKPLTVADAIGEYLRHKARDDDDRSNRATAKAQAAFERHVLADPIAKVELAKLRPDLLQAWLDRRVIVQGPDKDDPDAKRAARNTANRELARFKAALNFALKKRLVGSDFAWKGVEKFSNTTAKREYLPTDADLGALLTQGSPELARLIRVLDLTGLRPGEAYKLRVRDFDKISGTLSVSADTKTGKGRVVPVSTEAMTYLSELAKDRIGNAPLLARDDGAAWDSAEAAKRFRLLRDSLKLSPELVLYCLRHRWISRAVSRSGDRNRCLGGWNQRGDDSGLLRQAIRRTHPRRPGQHRLAQKRTQRAWLRHHQ
jgi:integrase